MGRNRDMQPPYAHASSNTSEKGHDDVTLRGNVKVTLTVVEEKWLDGSLYNPRMNGPEEILMDKRAFRQDMSDEKVWLFYPKDEAPMLGATRKKET